MWSLVFQDLRGNVKRDRFLFTVIMILFLILKIQLHCNRLALPSNSLFFSGDFVLDRPHDRVSVKEMKADWHSCLDNKVGFKVFFFNPPSI